MITTLQSLFLPDATVWENEGMYSRSFELKDGLGANAYYFSHPAWLEEYFMYCHRSSSFIDRWRKACGNLTGKIVLDIGCGPGNVFASLGGAPALLIGVDVAEGSLRFAQKQGYATLLGDASHLPFISGFADVVVLNATLHHCENMEQILREAARMVKPGGLLVTDHDPQLSAWNYRGPAWLLWEARKLVYRLTKHSFHKSDEQQQWALKSEIHHQPGHGVTVDFFRNILEPLGFSTAVFPHNNEAGAEVLQGDPGPAALKYQIGNLLSGRNPRASTSALTLMCVAKKQPAA